jgi:hypothetical protein
MACPIDIPAIISVIQYCRDKVETVRSNKESCGVLADDLELIHEILMTLDPIEAAKAEKHKFRCVMKKLYRISTRTKVLFDRYGSVNII